MNMVHILDSVKENENTYMANGRCSICIIKNIKKYLADILRYLLK